MEKIKELQRVSQRLNDLKEARKEMVDRQTSKMSNKTNIVKIINRSGDVIFANAIEFRILINMVDSQMAHDREEYQKLLAELFDQRGDI